ncbi:MAG: OmpA family protein, partial [Myxococcales bacterium]|nr:OmpA family protein [Myxococcales bacterium]
DEDGCPDEIPVMIGCTTELRGVWFQDGGARISESEREPLERAARALKSYPEVRVEVSGHADSSGSPARNLAISRARAEAVRAFLVERGVAPDRIETRAAGAEEPVASNDTPEGRRDNRRAEFKVLAR